MTSTLKRVQVEQRAWVLHNFGKRPAWMPIMGAVEELGELCHSYLKREQGIKGTPEQHTADIEDALADVVIFLCDVATAEGVDLDAALEKTWAIVKQRDFKKNAATGGDHNHEGGVGNVRV